MRIVCVSTLFFIYKNNIYKNSEPQILQFWRAISENVDAGMKIVT